MNCRRPNPTIPIVLACAVVFYCALFSGLAAAYNPPTPDPTPHAVYFPLVAGVECDGFWTWWVDEGFWLCLPDVTAVPYPYPSATPAP